MSSDPPDVSTGSSPSPARGSPPRFRVVALASRLLTDKQLAALEAECRREPEAALETTAPAAWDKELARRAARQKLITTFQARQLLLGRKRFTLGQYRILDEIGRGGMGQVFKAEHPMMGRVVAIKVLPRAKSTPETEAAFKREIRMISRLEHENLVRALDAGHDGNVFFLVTEYVAGLDLRQQVSRHGPLDEPRAALVVAQAARALAYAHEQGLVHRDVKPGNILVSRDGRAKMLDLGLAGSVLEAESIRLGRCVGTVDYMAPEQAQAPDDVGPAADIYSLGCTLYYTVTGRLPFPGGDRKDKLRRHLEERPPSAHTIALHVSLPFARVIEAMMEKSPRDRVDSAGDVIGLLRPWLPTGLLPMPRRPRPTDAGGQATTSPPAAASNAPSGSSGFLLGDLPGGDGGSRGPGGISSGVPSSQSGSSGWAESLPRSGPSAWQHRGRARWQSARHRAGVVASAAFWGMVRIFRLLNGQRLLWAALTSLLVAAPVGLAFWFLLWSIGQAAPYLTSNMLNGASPATLGWAAFAVLAAVLFLAACSRRSHS